MGSGSAGWGTGSRAWDRAAGSRGRIGLDPRLACCTAALQNVVHKQQVCSRREWGQLRLERAVKLLPGLLRRCPAAAAACIAAVPLVVKRHGAVDGPVQLAEASMDLHI
jgi:hypothetical protein